MSNRLGTLAGIGLALGGAAAWSGCADAGDISSITAPRTPVRFAVEALPSYEVRVIPAPASIAWRLNESGDVVGWTSSIQPFLYTAEDGVIVLPLFAGMSSGVARDVSDRSGGQVTIVGTGGGRALRWRVAVPGGSILEFSDLGVPSGRTGAEARAINGAGEIVGLMEDRAFYFTDATGVIDLGVPVSPAYAHDINETGVVTGYNGNVAFRWTRAGGVESLGVPPNFASSFGFSINEAGQVAGAVTSATGNVERLARFTSHSWEILGGQGETNLGWGINNLGDVVGEGIADSGSPLIKKGVIYTNQLGSVRYVDDFQIDPAPVWRVLYANDINDGRQIVGRATNTVVGGGAAVLLLPAGAPPPAPEEPDIAISPSSLDFGSVPVGTTADRAVSVSNVGTAGLTVTGLSTTNGRFTVVSPAVPFTVAQGGARAVTVRFSPSAAGAETGMLQIVSDDPDESPFGLALAGQGLEPSLVAFRINAGGADYTTTGGDLFIADRPFSAGGFGYVGGSAAALGGKLPGTKDDGHYLTFRSGPSFEYRLAGLASGAYQVTLLFTEPVKGQAKGGRVFDVTAEGAIVVDDLDLVSASGRWLRAHQETFTVMVIDGTLDLGFTAVVGSDAVVSAIEVVKQ